MLEMLVSKIMPKIPQEGGPFVPLLVMLKHPQQGGVHISCFTIFAPKEKNLVIEFRLIFFFKNKFKTLKNHKNL
jgi:hypothetical protein